MKFASIDIETTGTDPDNNQIVEIGVVLDELDSKVPIEDLPKFRAVIIHEEMQMGAYCANLHRDLWPEILAVGTSNIDVMGGCVKGCYDVRRGAVVDMFRSVRQKGVTDLVEEDVTCYNSDLRYTHYCSPSGLEKVLYEWLRYSITGNKAFFPEHNLPPSIKINVAGKNAGSFDIPFIENLPNWQGLVKFRRRTLDPASHFMVAADENLPDLQTCLNRAGILSTVQHTAVDDALDIIKLVRYIRLERSIVRE